LEIQAQRVNLKNMQIVLFEDHLVNSFLPLSHTRALADMFAGMYSVQDRWKLFFEEEEIRVQTRLVLQELYGDIPAGESLYVNARLIPNKEVVEAIQNLQVNEAFMLHDICVAARGKHMNWDSYEHRAWTTEGMWLNGITDLFSVNDYLIRADFALANKSNGARPSEHCRVIGNKDNLYIHPSAKVFDAVLNVESGPIFIDEEAEVMEGSMLRGPLYIGKHAVLKMGTKCYGPSSFGEECRIGGETSNVVFHPYSNKGHDGFLGNAVVGSWVNFGADSNCSNLKNNYSTVSISNDLDRNEFNTGLTFCGALVGDHAKFGINTMLNTGTYVGVAANVFAGDFPPKCVPSFTWGTGSVEHNLEKAIQTAERMMHRRGKEMSAAERAVLAYVFKITAASRS
jgi:UDP-N-acetylglucosamine diphosphorylase/glucosamine-1-phosphate N-acetyltransferase